MTHTRVKTTYAVEAAFGSTDIKELYCHHNHSNDITSFHNTDGSIVEMIFCVWEPGNDLWDAVQRLCYPFKNEWSGELKESVEYYTYAPWEWKK